MKLRAMALLILMVASFSLVAADRLPAECEVTKLTITLVPKKRNDEQVEEYRPLLALLREGLGVPVDIVRASSYESVIDSIVSGAVDLAVLGPAAYVIAHQRNPDIEAFASLAVEGGHYTPPGSFYNSILLVRKDSDVSALSELRRTRVALSDPSSTSGALIPKALFPLAVGDSFDGFFGAQVYAGSHDKALDVLMDKAVEAAFVSSSRADEYLKRGLISRTSFRVLWRSPPLHFDPFVFRGALCLSVRQRILELMTTPSPRLQQFLDSQHATDIQHVTHGDYQALETLL